RWSIAKPGAHTAGLFTILRRGRHHNVPRAPMLLVFGITLFLSSAPLFWVQLMVGKMVLPALGGTPAAWNTCMVFFQAGLLVGYAYAHLVPTRIGLRRHALVHLVLLLLL